jgi:hypothetical protein
MSCNSCSDDSELEVLVNGVTVNRKKKIHHHRNLEQNQTTILLVLDVIHDARFINIITCGYSGLSREISPLPVVPQLRLLPPSATAH